MILCILAVFCSYISGLCLQFGSYMPAAVHVFTLRHCSFGCKTTARLYGASNAEP